MLPELGKIPGHRPSDLLYFQFNVCAFGSSQKRCQDNISCAKGFLGNIKREPEGDVGLTSAQETGKEGGPSRRAGEIFACCAVQGQMGDPWAKSAGYEKSQISQEEPGTSARLRSWLGAGQGSTGSATGAGFLIRKEAIGATRQLHSQKQEIREEHVTAATCQVTAASLPPETCL